MATYIIKEGSNRYELKGKIPEDNSKISLIIIWLDRLFNF